jgi:hypothetical protein
MQCRLDPDNLYLAGRDLSGRFAVASRSHQAALVAGEHAPKNRHRTFLRLRMRAAKADLPFEQYSPVGKAHRCVLISRRLQLAAKAAHCSAVGFFNPSSP